MALSGDELLLDIARVAFLARPLLDWFRSDMKIERMTGLYPGAIETQLRVDFAGPGSFEFHSVLRLPPGPEVDVVQYLGFAMRGWLHDLEEGFVRYYREHLAKEVA